MSEYKLLFINIQIASLDRHIDQAVYELGVYPAYSVIVGERLTPTFVLQTSPTGLVWLDGTSAGKEEEIRIVEGKDSD